MDNVQKKYAFFLMASLTSKYKGCTNKFLFEEALLQLRVEPNIRTTDMSRKGETKEKSGLFVAVHKELALDS